MHSEVPLYRPDLPGRTLGERLTRVEKGLDAFYDYVGGHYPGGSQQPISHGETEADRLARYSRELAH